MSRHSEFAFYGGLSAGVNARNPGLELSALKKDAGRHQGLKGLTNKLVLLTRGMGKEITL
jgi:hypothetical protein